MQANDTQNRVIALKILAAIFQNSSMRTTWEKYVELITLRILNAHSDEKREVRTYLSNIHITYSAFVLLMASTLQEVDK